MSASIVLHPEREKSLHRHHPWIFASAVAEVKGRCRPGDTVDVLSHDGKWLARAAYSPESQIRARAWTFKRVENIDNPFFIRRLQDALRLRQRMIPQESSNAFRWIASESDGLPGVTIDVYAHVVVVQLLSAGADRQRDKIVWAVVVAHPV
jgi:23S rRNA (cytosine1962-C5)-methyltransferase